MTQNWSIEAFHTDSLQAFRIRTSRFISIFIGMVMSPRIPYVYSVLYLVIHTL